MPNNQSPSNNLFDRAKQNAKEVREIAATCTTMGQELNGSATLFEQIGEVGDPELIDRGGPRLKWKLGS